jgi:hypothetical protein
VIVRPFTASTFSSGKNLLKILYAKLMTANERTSQKVERFHTIGTFTEYIMV